MKNGFGCCELPEWAYCPLEDPSVSDPEKITCLYCHWFKTAENVEE